MPIEKSGRELKIGDIVSVWWSTNTREPNWDTIVEMKYVPLCHKNSKMDAIFKKGYCFAKFLSGVSMTIDYAEFYEVKA